jgi:hypothetical protein
MALHDTAPITLPLTVFHSYIGRFDFSGQGLKILRVMAQTNAPSFL